MDKTDNTDKTKHLISLIQQHRLKPAISREISFFLVSSVKYGYTYGMTARFGFSYDAICVIGNHHFMEDFMDVEVLSQKMEQFLHQQGELFQQKLLPMLMNEFRLLAQVKDAAATITSSDPMGALRLITSIVQPYFAILGFYNTIWRYVEVTCTELSPPLLQRISQERNTVAGIYPQIDKLVSLSASELGKQQGFDGDLLTFLSYPEMKSYLETKEVSPTQLTELAQRREYYLYLLIEGEKEYIISNKDYIKQIRARCFPEPDTQGVTQLQGQVGYPGKVKGRVFSIFDFPASDLRAPFILVANSTHPQEIELIQKCSAMVVDEGGILSHAAIISRELKKPCIIGTKIATKVLKTGMFIEVDAEKGRVRILTP